MSSRLVFEKGDWLMEVYSDRSVEFDTNFDPDHPPSDWHDYCILDYKEDWKISISLKTKMPDEIINHFDRILKLLAFA